MENIRKYAALFLMLTLGVSISSASHAACTSPSGVTAEIIYNSSEHVPQYCDGSQWISMGPVGAGPGGNCVAPVGAFGTIIYNTEYSVPQFCAGKWVAMGPVPGTGGAGCSSPSGVGGAFVFNNDAGYMQYCDGTNWIALRGYHSAAVNTCDKPNAFDFTDDSAAPLNTTGHPSDIVQITGSFTCTVNVSVSGDTGAAFRICNDGTCSGAPAWGTAPQTITSGQWVQVRLDTPDSHSVARTAYLTVGQTTADWIATTPACDNTPNSITNAFTDLTSQPKSTDTLSNIVQITGIEAHAECGGAVTISGTASDEQFRICGSSDPTCSSPGAWTTSATIANTEYLQLRMTTSASHGTGLTAVPDINGISDTWSTTTCSSAPDAFAFTDLTNQPIGQSDTRSDIVHVTGPSACTYSTGVSGDASAEYRICSDATCSATPAFTASGSTLTAGDYVQARLTTSSSNSTAVNAAVSVGSSSDTFTATTCGDPGAFSFTDLTDQPLSQTDTRSDIVAITGTAGCNFNVTLSGDASAEYRICNDGTCSGAPAWGTSAGVVAVGQYVQTRVTTSATNGATVNATLDVGATPQSNTFSATTVPVEKIVFVATNGGVGYTGGFGGVSIANSICAGEAAGGGLSGTYKAWIADSSGSNDPANNFTGVGGTFRYKLPGGTKVADSWADLTDGTLDAGINENASGGAAGANSVWANVATNGTTLSTNTNQGACQDWASGASNRKGQEGTVGSATSSWTDNATATGCNASYYLYCFQQ